MVIVMSVPQSPRGAGTPRSALSGADAARYIALCFGEIFSLAVLAMKGRLGLAECSTALALMVPLVLGLAGSGLVRRWLCGERLRNALLVFAVASG
jgi:hypothetical protein